jgi:hypothetical protein
MTLSGARIQAILATAILVGAVFLCGSAEAAPKARNASPVISTQIGKYTNTVTCYVYNSSDKNVCVTYDVYPVWYASQAKPGTVTYNISPKTGSSIAWAFAAQQASMQCKLVSARFISWHQLCSPSYMRNN